MKITCQTCQSKYTVSDEKVQGKTVKIKCRKCGATILVNSSGVTTNGATDGSDAAADAGAAAQGSFLVNVTDSDQRSMSLKEIVDAYNASLINAETYVWADGMSDWTPLGQVQQIVSELQSAAGAPAAAPSVPPAAAAAPRAAARRDPGRRADVFGGGGAEAQAEVAAPAAGLSANLLRSPPAKADENSVLFSLSALTSRVGGPAMPQGSSTAKEDSGLIDLKALASSASTSTSPAAGLVSDTVGLFPLGMPIAPVAQPIAIPEAQPKNRAPVFIALGGAVAVVAIVGAFLFMKDSGKPQPTPDPNAAISAAPLPEPEPTVVQRPPPEPTPSASAAATKTPPRWTGTGKVPIKSGTTSGGATTTGGGDTKPPPVKSSGGCGCAPGDLMCAMKCSTKH